MLIQNGYIRVKESPTTTEDENGNTIISGGGLGSYIDAQYRTNKLNNIGSTDSGVFTIATYTILINKQTFNITGSTIELSDCDKSVIGEYQVTKGVLLKEVDLIHITVS